MPSKKTGRPFPKQRAPREVPKLKFKRWWKGGDYIPRRSAVSEDRHLAFVKSYETLHDLYLKVARPDDPNDQPLITPAEMTLYLDRVLLELRGKTQSIEEYAHERGVTHKTIYAWLDNLENVNLIHRERSADGSAHSIIIVTHLPLEEDEMRGQRAELLRRRKKKHVQGKRQAAGRNNRDWLPKTYSRKKLFAAFDTKARAELFENIIADVIYTNRAERYYSRAQFAEDVKVLCKKLKLPCEPKHLELAFEIKDYLERVI